MFKIYHNEFCSTEWKYYNNAIIPSVPPNEILCLTKKGIKELFKKYPKAFFIRWYSDFDCSEKTEWWYIIKDTPYNTDCLKAKRRYEITKARKFLMLKEFPL